MKRNVFLFSLVLDRASAMGLTPAPILADHKKTFLRHPFNTNSIWGQNFLIRNVPKMRVF